MGKRGFALAALWLVVVGSLASMSGCYGRNCEGEVAVWGANAGEGKMASADKWQSTDVNDKWLPFPRQRVWIFEMRELGDRIPFDWRISISAQESPNTESGGSLAQSGGNLSEISGLGPGRMVVKNGTCSDYYLRVVAEASPLPTRPATPSAGADDAGAPTSTPVDAGADAEAGP